MNTLATNIIDVTMNNAQAVLLETSKEKLVLIDFWADWCEPCKHLTPILERIAASYPDTLLLAKVNCDTEQELAAQFQIRSLPTLIVFKDGQALDGLMGAQSEQAIRDMLEKHLPKAEDQALDLAKQALAAEDFETAYTHASEAYQLAHSVTEVRLVLADAAARTGQTEQARELLTNLSMADQSSSYYQHIITAIELAESTANSPEVQALEEQVQQDPDNLELQQQLALQYHMVKRHEEALRLIFSLLRDNLSHQDIRKHAIDMLNTLPEGSPLASQFRKKLYSMLY